MQVGNLSYQRVPAGTKGMAPPCADGLCADGGRIRGAGASLQSGGAEKSLAAIDQKARLGLQKLAAEMGPNAQVSVEFKYVVGPDGQLYAAGGEVRASERVVRDGQGNEVDSGYTPGLPPLPNSLDALKRPQLSLSPEDELQAFGITEPDPNAAVIQELQNADTAVRSHEGLHFRAAGGLVEGLPVYNYVEGPDGRHYAVAGHVAVSGTATSDPVRQSRDAQTLANSATAPGDASPQDLNVARDAFQKAAGAYGKALEGEQLVSLAA